MNAVCLYPRHECRVPHTPDFLGSFVGSLHLLRLSLKKGAHVVLARPAYRKFVGISLVFREMWDTAALSLKPVADPTTLYGCPTFAPAYVGRKRWAKPSTAFCSSGPERTRISYFALLATITCAALLKESRMQMIKATALDKIRGSAVERSLCGCTLLEMFFDRA
jgi:hypothetical protein